MEISKSRAIAAVLLVAIALTVFGLLGVGGYSAAAPAPTTQTRTYYIAIDEVQWDYAPSGINQITGLPFGEAENVFVQNVPFSISSQLSGRIGKVYIKA